MLLLKTVIKIVIGIIMSEKSKISMILNLSQTSLTEIHEEKHLVNVQEEVTGNTRYGLRAMSHKTLTMCSMFKK